MSSSCWRVTTVSDCGVSLGARFSRVELLDERVVYDPVPSVVDPGALPDTVTVCSDTALAGSAVTS